jgi:hypothetical protein
MAPRCCALAPVIAGVLGSVGLVRLCCESDRDALSPSPLYPRWLALCTPTVWLMFLRESGLLRLLPSPIGLVLAGNSFHRCRLSATLPHSYAPGKVGDTAS